MLKHFSFAVILLSYFVVVQSSCSKNGGGATPVDTVVQHPPVVDTTITSPVDPALAGTIGFFMNDWVAKTFTAPAYKDTTISVTNAASVTVDFANVLTKVSPALLGNNANSWMTQIVDQSVLMNHLTNMHSNIIRFPGGSISDIYFWNSKSNAFPADAPSTLVDASTGNAAAAGYWAGMNTDGWTISVDSYYKLLQQTNNQGIITVNYGYARYGTGNNPVAAAAHLAADWVRYDDGRTKYWEVGNEIFGSWEAGFRISTSANKDSQPEYVTGNVYGQHFKVFADSMRNAAKEIGKTIYIGAVMLEAPAASWESNTVKTWNSGVFAGAASSPDYYIVHSYYTPYNANSPAREILDSASSVTNNIMGYMNAQMTAAAVGTKPVALTEWNINAVSSMQMVSSVNGIHAVIVLNEAIKNKFGLTARWDLANGWNSGNDMGLFSSGDEPGTDKWSPRPAFYYQYFLQKFLGDRGVKVDNTNGNLMAYATSYTSGEMSVTLVNKGTAAQDVQITTKNFRQGSRYYWYTLVGGTDNGSFSRKVYVNGAGPSGVSGGPASYATLQAYAAATTNGIKINVPANGVVFLVVDKK